MGAHSCFRTSKMTGLPPGEQYLSMRSRPSATGRACLGRAALVSRIPVRMSSRFIVTIALVVAAAQFSARAATGQPAPLTIAPPIGSSAPIAAWPARARVMLRADADDASLEAREIGRWEGKLGWRPICAAPCGAPLFGGYEFRVGSPSKVTSAPFVLTDAASAIVNARMGSRAQQVTGIVLTSVGGGVAGLSLTLAALMSDCTGELGCDKESAEGALLVAAVSALVLGTGIYLIATSRTAVDVSASIPLGGGVALTPRALVF